MNTKLVYVADLHGNKSQYLKLFDYAKKKNADAVIIGGDISPKSPDLRTIKLQKDFLETFLLPEIKRLSEATNGHCSIMLIMGNDDFKANYDFLKENEKKFKYILLDEKPFNWRGYFITGYSFVPYTPFKYKDWEKADLINKKETDRKDIVLEGIRSSEKGFVPHHINLDERKDSIEKDLNDMLKKINTKKTIMVIHCAPYNTSLDLIKDNKHVGSEALRKVIEEKQPLLTLHGHIHESVELSGNFMDKIKNTICISPGNDYRENKINIIEIDMNNLKESKRISL